MFARTPVTSEKSDLDYPLLCKGRTHGSIAFRLTNSLLYHEAFPGNPLQENGSYLVEASSGMRLGRMISPNTDQILSPGKTSERITWGVCIMTISNSSRGSDHCA